MAWPSGVKSAKLLHEHTRPGAGPGLWTATLLPIGLLVNAFRHNVTVEYRTIVLLSWTILCNQALFYRDLLRPNRANQRQFLASIALTGTVTSLIISVGYGQNLAGLVGGLLVTFMLQWLCRGLLQHLPKSFTVGEAAVVAQGVILFLFKSLALDLPRAVRGNNQPQDDAVAMACIVEWGVLLVVLLIGLMRLLGERVRNVFVFSTLTGLIGLAVTLTPITQPIPLLYVLEFLLTDPQKVIVLIIFAGLIAATGAFCYWHTASKRPTSTALRKSFHLVIVAVFLVGILYQRLVLYLGSGVALCLLLLLEAVRIAKVDNVSEILNDTVKSFVDAQDSGIVALTPIYLLVGSAAPLFLSPVALRGDKEALLPLLSGVLSVGVGDSFAGFVGSLYGRHRWHGSKKSVEGTVANAVSQVVFVGLLMVGGFLPVWTNASNYIICLCGVVANAIVEAKTDQVDNLIVPLVTFAIFSWI